MFCSKKCLGRGLPPRCVLDGPFLWPALPSVRWYPLMVISIDGDIHWWWYPLTVISIDGDIHCYDSLVAVARSPYTHNPFVRRHCTNLLFDKCFTIDIKTIKGSRWHGRPVGVMVSYLLLWHHIYGYGIISTVPYEQQKIIRQNNLISENILSFHQFNRPPVSSWTLYGFDVYDETFVE